MALADYSTAVEKISALKAAMIDPALIKINNGALTTTEPIHLVTWNRVVIDGYTFYNTPYYMTTMDNHAISSYFGAGRGMSGGFLYILDSDITYTDPVDVYTDRLGLAATCEVKLSAGTSYTDNINDTLYMTHYYRGNLFIGGAQVYNGSSYAGNFVRALPIPKGIAVVSSDNTSHITYIELPADW